MTADVRGFLVGWVSAGLVLVALALGCPPSMPPAPPVTCGFNNANVCGGTCPTGQQCSSPSPTVCACVEADAGSPFCGFDKAHVCGGPCPANQSCQARGATVCACFPGG